jgi:hypothetical protein
VIVWFVAELLYIETISPALNTLEGTVTPPVVMEIYLPTSVIVRVYADTCEFTGTVVGFPIGPWRPCNPWVA